MAKASKREKLAVALVRSNILGYDAMIYPAKDLQRQVESIAEVMETAYQDAGDIISLLDEIGYTLRPNKGT